MAIHHHHSLRPGFTPASSPGNATGTGTVRSSGIPYLSATVTTPRTKTRRPSTSPSNGPIGAQQRRLSEDPNFEDLIMRGDTLRMTLTPSRFRQSSKESSVGGVYEVSVAAYEAVLLSPS